MSDRPLYDCWGKEDQHEIRDSNNPKQDQHLYTKTAVAKVEPKGQRVDIANREGCAGGMEKVTENVGQGEAQEYKDNVANLTKRQNYDKKEISLENE